MIFFWQARESPELTFDISGCELSDVSIQLLIVLCDIKKIGFI